MPASDRLTRFLRKPALMHQAAHIRGHEDVGIAGANVLNLQLAHRRRDVRKTHRKRAAESAALLRFAERGQLHTGDR